MSSAAMRNATLAVLLAAAPAPAETFHNKDGVVFEGTIRLVVSNAAVCNVLEEKYTAQEYEQLKANQGQPLDLWQVDFAVRNESGREIEYLRASSWVHSEHPPCTNWSGEGPGGGPVLPEPSLLISTGWGDYYQVLQRPYGMRPGQQERSARYLVVFHEHQPRFGEWDIDYTFAKEAGAGKEPAAGASRTPVSGRATSTAPAGSESQENLFWQSIVDSTNPADFEAYLEQFPNGVFRLLAQNRLTAMREPAAGDRPVAGSGSPPAGAGRVASTPADTPPRAGESRVFDGMEFVWVPAGEFQMGSTRETFVPEGPVTQVRISRGFWMGQHEVTQAQWQEVKGTNPSGISECGRSCPVEQMSWNDAQEFIGRMNAHAGGNRYRLPTEAEWEYAARAGTTGDRYGNLDAIAWYRDNSGPSSKPVGQKAPNAWGLHDMLGNVHEWVADWYGDYPGGTVTDPQGPVSGSYRVFRGGSWSDDADEIRASYRCYDRSAHCIGLSRPGASVMLGFRLLRME